MGCDVVVCEGCLAEGGECPRCEGPLAEARDEASTSADEGAERGRRQVVASGVSVMGAVVLLGTLNGASLSALLVPLVITGLVLFQVFRGRAWARWAFVLLTALGSVAYAVAALGVGANQPRAIALGLALVFGLSTLTIAFSPHVRRFLKAQRARHV